MSKYYNRKTTIDGITFDSRKEAFRYQELKFLEKAGEIKNLTLQPKFLLQDGFRHNGKTYRKIEYIADFSYRRTEDDVLVIEDVKGVKTDVFKLKEKMLIKKLMESGINFEFVIL